MGFSEAIITLAAVWIAWAVFNISLVLMTERRAKLAGVGAYVVGIWRPRIVVMPEVRDALSARENIAVWMHEYGHLHHRHIQKNLVIAILLPFYRSRARVTRQELEADGYVREAGLGPELASALRKLSSHPFDLLRAQLLDRG